MEIQCMEPVRIPNVNTDPGFVHQIKWDGIRGITFIDEGGMRIYTKNGNECTAQYPELARLPKSICAKQTVIDGELVVFTEGRPSFYNVLRRSLARSEAGIKKLRPQFPVRYIVFDILSLNNEDLRKKPLYERQRILREALKDSAEAALTENFEDGEALYSLMKEKNMEGIVSKRKESVYTPGKEHSDWFKTKIAKKMLCAVIGINLKNSLPSSLALGVYRGEEIVGVGGVSSGLKTSDLARFAEYAFKNKLGGNRETVFIKPTLTCWVRFAEWTDHGTLRHPVLLGFSDREAGEANGEEFSA